MDRTDQLERLHNVHAQCAEHTIYQYMYAHDAMNRINVRHEQYISRATACHEIVTKHLKTKTVHPILTYPISTIVTSRTSACVLSE